jgi:hypothetical protein
MIKVCAIAQKAAKSQTMRLINGVLLLVSDTHEACRSATPAHQTGMDEEQSSSFGVESNRG